MRIEEFLGNRLTKLLHDAGIATRLYHYYIAMSYALKRSRLARKMKAVLSKNAEKIRSRRRTDRSVFIVCTGPSLREVDLSTLERRAVIGVSNLLFHPEYSKLSPIFHVECASHGPYSREEWIENYRRMGERALPNTLYILNYADHEIHASAGAFQSENTAYYLAYSDIFHNPNPNFAAPIPNVQTGSILALMLAVYLGYENIFLLGVDHDYFPAMKYERSHDEGSGVGSDVKAMESQTKLLAKMHTMWEQYDWVADEANRRGLQIYNLNPRSALETFSKITLAEAIAKSTSSP